MDLELNVEQMAELMLIKSASDEAEALISDHKRTENQARVTRLASFAQAGIWPENLKITRSNWAPWARKRFMPSYCLFPNSLLVITEDGGLYRLLEANRVRHSLQGFLAGSVLIATEIFWRLTPPGHPASAITTGLFVGLSVGTVLSLFLKGPLTSILGDANITGLEEVPLDDLSAVELGDLSTAESAVTQLVEQKKAAIQAAKQLRLVPGHSQASLPAASPTCQLCSSPF